MREYFENLDYAVDCARDKQSADTYLARGEYGMLMVDSRLSAVDCEEGLEIVERVRRSFPATKTIMLTAYGSPEVEAKARKCGADAFVQKPTPLASSRKSWPRSTLPGARSVSRSRRPPAPRQGPRS